MDNTPPETPRQPTRQENLRTLWTTFNELLDNNLFTIPLTQERIGFRRVDMDNGQQGLYIVDRGRKKGDPRETGTRYKMVETGEGIAIAGYPYEIDLSRVLSLEEKKRE